MKTELEDLPYLLSERDANQFDDAFADFESGADLPDAAQNRILSGLMRKAGFEMKTSKKGRQKKCIAVISALLAAALIGTVSAAAFVPRMTREQVIDQLMRDSAASYLEENALTETQEAENPHFKVYLDTLVSDGNACRVILCFEALDELGMESMRSGFNGIPGNGIPDMKGFYADTGEEITFVGAAGCENTAMNDERHSYMRADIPLFMIDTQRPITFRFNTGEVLWDYEDETNLMNGIEMTVSLLPNVTAKTVRNENGLEMLLSPLGISCCAPVDTIASITEQDEPPVALLSADGQETVLPLTEYIVYNRTGIHPVDPLYGMTSFDVCFNSLMDIEEYTGVRIGDGTFLAVD